MTAAYSLYDKNTVMTTNKASQLLSRILSGRQFAFVRNICSAQPQARVYLVGGCVRDALIGREIKDIDIVIGGVPLKKIETLLRSYGAVNAVGRTFGVLKFTPRTAMKNTSTVSNVIDIALPRTEHSVHHTGHYRDFAVKSDWRLPIQDDLSRRDFTINAIAFDCIEKKFIDPFGGIGDIRKEVMRCVGLPADRFAEDYSRMLRALRFSCQLGFTLDRVISQALVDLLPRINKQIRSSTTLRGKRDSNVLRAVPYETVGKELSKALIADPVRAAELYDTYAVLDALIPEALPMKGCPQPPKWHSEGDVWTHTKLCLGILAGKRFRKEFGDRPLDPLLYWAVFFHDIGKPAALKTPERDGVDRIRFDGHDRIGALIAKAAVERLRLASVEGMNIDTDDLWWLVHYHLVMLNTDLKHTKHTTLEKYFFKNPRRGLLLRQLMFADSLGSKRADGKSSLGSYNALKRRLKEYETIFHEKNRLPKPIIDGNEIMKALKIPPGPMVGQYMLQIREEQLACRIINKKGALTFLKNRKKKT